MRRIHWTHLRGAGPGPVSPIEKPSAKLARIAAAAARARHLAPIADSMALLPPSDDLAGEFSRWLKARRCFA